MQSRAEFFASPPPPPDGRCGALADYLSERNQRRVRQSLAAIGGRVVELE